jgi:dynein heavy chain
VTEAIPRLAKIFREKREEYLNFKKSALLAEESGGSRSGGYNRGGSSKYPTPFDDFKDPNLTIEEKCQRWDAAWKLNEPYNERESYYGKIKHNKSMNDTTEAIGKAVESIKTIFYEDAQYWMRNDFKQFYNMRKGIRRILASRDSLDEDPLARYKFYIETVIENIGQVRKESVQKPQLFIQFDNSKLLDTFLDIGNEHISKIYNLIVDEAREELNSLYSTFESVAEQLKTPSTDLKHLKENKDLYEKTVSELAELKGRIQPIEMKFEYLKSKSQEHQLTEQEHNKLRLIHDEWAKFEEALAEGAQVLAKSQKQLRQEVDSQVEDFRRSVEENKKQFQENAPYSSDKTENTRAKEKIQEYKLLTNDLRDREDKMKFGLDIFKIDHPVYPELSFVEKESGLLEKIWKVKEDWDKEWDKWKESGFKELNVKSMDDRAGEFQDIIRNVDREIRSWGIYDSLKNKIESFRQTMPLIMDLRNEAMRERHWKLLKVEVREEFEEDKDEFTLEKVFELQLNQHAEFISDLSENAAKELKIERQLEKIEKTWREEPSTELKLIKETSKGTGEEYYKIMTAENIYNVIEEHVVILSNNKSGAFYKQFEETIDYWEENLAKISEIIELLMVVQSKWGYLESIFTGQQDIMKQLSQEHTIFQGVNAGFKAELERINKDKNAMKALLVEGLDKTLEEMDIKLEHIQKNLDDYLKLKRQNFPRFFFLSNEDLLEIMGQSKDPTPMNKHVKKCFEGIAQLKIDKQKSRNKTPQITSFSAPDGEEIELTTPISGHDKVEDWFKDLLRGMQAQIRALFKNPISPLKEVAKKAFQPEKLAEVIRQHKGQYLITSCQIEWTREVTSTLISLENGSSAGGYKRLKGGFKIKVEKYTNYVKKLSDDTRTRNKLVALITIEQHNRDIVDSLAKKNITSPKHFEWVQQLKVTREENELSSEPPTIIIRQTNCQFEYGNEYQGNNGRLVITPLTDRAYMTLTNALNMCRGGAPQGPAGTGKTETVKDLGKNLAYFVVVQNCSDSLDYQSLGKMFEGLASAGVWG